MLLDWQGEYARALPWRNAPAGKRDGYSVWVSEIMAQQTRLSTVEDYFNRWMAEFPTIAALAHANLHDVLKCWEGLGYYARARNLHRAAQIVDASHQGKLPQTRRELLALPGIGPYTAGAILSLAYGQPEPAVDGNVKRVISRLDNIATSIDDSATMKIVWEVATELVNTAPDGQGGMFNEALMDLGARVCTPTSPSCDCCPVRSLCAAYARGVVDLLPVRSKRQRTPHYDVSAAVIWQDAPHRSRLLIAQRKTDGMLGGLWEFPGGKLEAEDSSLEACLQREIAEELGIQIAVQEPVVQVLHAYTHFRITLHAFHAQHIGGQPQAIDCADWRWVDWHELDGFPFPVTDQKIIRALEAERLGERQQQ